jgi:FSR family fosmidomycin resistance protein-like MFS transporter
VFAGFLVAPGVAPKLVLLTLLGAVTAGWYPLLKARLYAELPDRSGTAMAISSLTGVAAALPPLGIGLLAASVGVAQALWLLLLAPAALLLLLPGRASDRRS